MAINPAWFAPDLYWEDLSIAAQWRTQARTITEPDLVAWINLTWLTEELFTNLHDRGDSAIEGRFVPDALVFAFAEALTLGAVRIKGLAFLRSEIDVRRATFVGDTIHVESTVSALRATSKPDRATAETRNEVMNQRGEIVIAYNALRMIRRRAAAS